MTANFLYYINACLIDYFLILLADIILFQNNLLIHKKKMA